MNRGSGSSCPDNLFIPSSRFLTQQLSELERMRLSLRQRWENEYLLELRRNGWEGSGREPNVGEVVLVVDDPKRRHVFQLAKVERLLRGKDGVARVIELRGRNGLFLRPARKLYPLEMTSLSAGVGRAVGGSFPSPTTPDVGQSGVPTKEELDGESDQPAQGIVDAEMDSQDGSSPRNTAATKFEAVASKGAVCRRPSRARRPPDRYRDHHW